MIKFKIRGSDDQYDVVVDRHGEVFRMTCSCLAGQHGTLCKHRVALLDGDVTAVLSGNGGDVAQVRALFRGTEAERSYLAIRDLEQQKAATEEKLKREKKALARKLAE